jgi:hypothetical protein
MNSKDKDFTKLRDKMILDKRVDPSMLKVYSVLRYHAKYKEECWPSLDTLKYETGVSRRTIMRCTNRLQELGYLQKKKRYNNSVVYSLLDAPSGDKYDTTVDVMIATNPTLRWSQDGHSNKKNEPEERIGEQDPCSLTSLELKSSSSSVTASTLPTPDKKATPPSASTEGGDVSFSLEETDVLESVVSGARLVRNVKTSNLAHSGPRKYETFREWFEREPDVANVELWLRQEQSGGRETEMLLVGNNTEEEL